MTGGTGLKSGVRLALLRLAAALLRPWVQRTRLAPGPPRRVLVIRPDHVGDVLFVTPALAALRRALPHAHITALVGPWSLAVLERNPDVDEVLTCPFPGFARADKPSPLWPYRLAWAEARRLGPSGYDLALNLRPDFWWGALLVFLMRMPRRVGSDVAECRPFLTECIPLVPGEHAVEQNLRVVAAALGARRRAPAEPRPPLQFVVTEEARARAIKLMKELGESEGPLVAIHPGSGGDAKLWPAERWAEVANRLAGECGARFILTGSRGEAAQTAAVAAGLTAPALDLAGRTSLDELAAVFERCAAVLGVDSGPLHLATALDVPTVRLYGPSRVDVFGPWGDPARHVALVSALECVPCEQLASACGMGFPSPCLLEITPEQVITATNRLLAATGGAACHE